MDRTRPRHRRERDAYRFVEVLPGPRLTVLEGLATVSGALLGGAVLALIVPLGITLTVGEVVDGVRYESEEVLRGTIGWWALLLVAAALAFVPLRAVATLVLADTLLVAGRTRTDVPPRSVRKRIARANPPGALAGLAWTVLGVALVAGGAVAPFAMDDDEPARGPVIAVSAVVVVAAVVGLLLLRVLRERWAQTQHLVRTTWGDNETRAAEAAERRRRARLGARPPARADRRRASRRRWAGAVLGIAGAVGLVAFLVGARMRHPVKHGPDEYYGPVGETAIDVLVGVGGVLVGAVLLVGAVWLAASALSPARARRAVLAQLRDAVPPSAPLADDVAQDLLSSWSPGGAVAVLWLVAVGLVAPTTLASLTGAGLALVLDLPYGAMAVGLAVTAVLAAVTVVLDVPRSARVRAAVRERWHPGDDATP